MISSFIHTSLTLSLYLKSQGKKATKILENGVTCVYDKACRLVCSSRSMRRPIVLLSVKGSSSLVGWWTRWGAVSGNEAMLSVFLQQMTLFHHSCYKFNNLIGCEPSFWHGKYRHIIGLFILRWNQSVKGSCITSSALALCKKGHLNMNHLK